MLEKGADCADRYPLDMEDVLDADAKTAASARKFCIDQMSQALRLFRAIADEGAKKISLTPLKDEFCASFEGRTSTSIANSVKNVLEAFAEERRSRRDHLLKEVDMPHLSQVVATLFINQR